MGEGKSMSHDFPTASMTADVICITGAFASRRLDKDGPHILLVERGNDPYKGMWALPGGFVNAQNDTSSGGEKPVQAAVRELAEETGLEIVASELEPVGVYTHPGRDPRGRVITFAYLLRWALGTQSVQADDDAVDAKWFPISEFSTKGLPRLAFDHELIIDDALNVWRGSKRVVIS